MKKICIVSPSLKLGGIQRELVELANLYSRIDSVYFLTIFKSPKFYELDDKVTLVDLSSYREKKESKIQQFLYYLKLLIKLRKKINKLNPDAVLTYGDVMGPLLLLSLIGTSHKVFIGDKTSHDYKFKFPIKQLKKYLYPFSTGYVAQTKKAAEYREKEFSGKLNITVINNGIRDVKLYSDISREKIILYLGRFAWEKAPERVLKAFSKIKNQSWKLLMAGDGPKLEEMKLYAKEINVGNRVEFLGQIKEVDMLFAKSSVFVLPSVLEGFPNALCEAMSAGLPSIAFDTIPYEDIIENGTNGLIVSDIDELILKIDYLIENPNFREKLGAEAKKIAKKLSKEKAAKKLYFKIFKLNPNF
jgi:glycosyltransferase involved in cell wall biosynthesis